MTSDDVYLHRRGHGARRSLHGEWKVIMFGVMASNYTMFAFTLAVFPLITFVVNMMYLQII